MSEETTKKVGASSPPRADHAGHDLLLEYQVDYRKARRNRFAEPGGPPAPPVPAPQRGVHTSEKDFESSGEPPEAVSPQ